MDLKELESFCEAAKLRSFSRAAKVLRQRQPTVTKHIQKLEAELHLELFRREERPVQLTSAGANLLRVAAPLVEGIKSFIDGGKESPPSPPVVVACAHGFMNEVLLKSVRGFREQMPHSLIRIRIGVKPEIMKMVQTGEVELAITLNPGEQKGIAFQPMAASERVLITPRDHPLLTKPLKSLGEIAGYPLILMGFQTPTRKLLEDEFKRLSLGYEVAVELDSMDMVKRYVELGLGVGIGHRAALDPEDYRHLGIVSLSAFMPSELVGVVTRKDHRLSGPASDFVATFSATLRRAESAKPMSIVGRRRKSAA